MPDKKKKIIFIVGPTAVGKTEAAFHLASKINSEILSCDSMQVYKGMDIITSKPPKALRKKVRHHLIDIISPTKEYNVSKYRKETLAKMGELLKKGKAPIFVGGTGLYMSILIDGLFKEGAKNKSIRLRLYKELEALGSRALYKRLKKIDPQAALKIHPNDAKRIIRALEVFMASGTPISKLQKQRKGLSDKYGVKIFCLNIERDKLYRKIDERVDRMFRKGLVGEVKKLLKLKLSKTASCAIGIRELKGYFDGLYALEEARRLIKRNTRKFAKKQPTLLKKDKRIKWLEVGEKENSAAIAKRIWKELS